ncbi:phospholipid scramblase 2-like [Lethenteron reissneri]|uniref:phospholipid scramblase 2-like n=1 Tax=Lethenteron reissneri TaxID=7753 RepID=UPI002AB76969|nr:phospholipid scramblase 2-like [Lethenteron reissneri]
MRRVDSTSPWGEATLQPPLPPPTPSPISFLTVPPTQQHKSTVWMTAGPPQTNCPPGLEFMSQVDQLLVSKLRENTEETASELGTVSFKVKNSMGQRVFFVTKRPYPALALTPSRAQGAACSWEATMTDGGSREVMRVVRRFRCGCHRCSCNVDDMEVQSPPGSIIGYLRQKVTETEPTFAVTDVSNKAQLWLRGPSCAVYCTVNNAVSYQILSKDERTQVGAVVKQWMKGAAAESAGGGSSSKGGKTFIQFPMDLAPKLKATLLASCFLIDHVYTKGQRRGGDGTPETRSPCSWR